MKRAHESIDVKLNQSESKYAIKTRKDDISLPAVIVFSGSQGSGKTYSCIQWVRHFKKRQCIHRTFLLESNNIYSNLKTLQKKDCYNDEHAFNSALATIINEVKKHWKEYEQKEEYKKIFY